MCFKTLFDNEDMYEIVKNFVVCHIDAPGQEEGAAVYPVGWVFCIMWHRKYIYILLLDTV